MLPLSVAVVGLLLVEAPAFTEAAAYVSVGAVLAVTLTVRFAIAVPEFPSVTVRTTVLAPGVAVQSAATVAVMVPAVLVREGAVMGAGTDVAVTTRLPTAVSVSLTVAIVETLPAVP